MKFFFVIAILLTIAPLCDGNAMPPAGKPLPWPPVGKGVPPAVEKFFPLSPHRAPMKPLARDAYNAAVPPEPAVTSPSGSPITDAQARALLSLYPVQE